MSSVINHVGDTPNVGHYTTYGTCSDNSFYVFNDEVVSEIKTREEVKKEEAYVLFFELNAFGLVENNDASPLLQVSFTIKWCWMFSNKNNFYATVAEWHHFLKSTKPDTGEMIHSTIEN